MTERPWSSQEFQQVRDMHAAFQMLNQPVATPIQAHQVASAADRLIRPFANKFLQLNAGEASIYGALFSHAVHMLMAERTEDVVKITVATERDKEQQELLAETRNTLISEIPTADAPAIDAYLATVTQVANESAAAFLTGILPPTPSLIANMAERLKQAREALPEELFRRLRSADHVAAKELRQEGKQGQRRDRQGKGPHGPNGRRGGKK